MADPPYIRKLILQRPLWPPPPYLTVRLEAFYHLLPLSLVLLEKIPEDLFLLGVVLSDPLRAALRTF
jgi:hypothetical protein